MERSAPAKIFEILFWLETSKRPLQRRGSEVASTLVLKSVSASTSPKCPFIIIIIIIIIIINFNWYSLHARLNSHYEAWRHKKRKHKKVKA